MRISLAADHAGFELKQRLVRELEKLGHEVSDFGTSSTESCDYPDYAIPAARAVAEGKADRAILACTNGIGMAMTANRIPGVRAALVYSARTAAMTRQHHDSNVLCLGAGEFPADELLEWVRIWLSTPFEGGRHARRVGKFEALENK
jgi:ribose 5-phosphate isomerase B